MCGDTGVGRSRVKTTNVGGILSRGSGGATTTQKRVSGAGGRRSVLTPSGKERKVTVGVTVFSFRLDYFLLYPQSTEGSLGPLPNGRGTSTLRGELRFPYRSTGGPEPRWTLSILCEVEVFTLKYVPRAISVAPRSLLVCRTLEIVGRTNDPFWSEGAVIRTLVERGHPGSSRFTSHTTLPSSGVFLSRSLSSFVFGGHVSIVAVSLPV